MKASPLSWAYMGLGGNVGDTVDLFLNTLGQLDTHPDIRVISVASLFKSIAWHPEAHTPMTWGSIPREADSHHLSSHTPLWFLNTGILLRTALTPQALLSYALAIEAALGRIRIPHVSKAELQAMQRPIDIDLWLYAPVDTPTAWLSLQDPLCRLPHPHIMKRPFVLAPLAELLKHQGIWYPEGIPLIDDALFSCPDTREKLWYTTDIPSKYPQGAIPLEVSPTCPLMPYQDTRWQTYIDSLMTCSPYSLTSR
ncbi:MAG: 2-amino-4-hydroxy-6-hydroxymethyldihydropteridine diphosphokinase [Vampirovibrionales bacterium]